MVTDAEIQAIIEQNEAGSETAFEAYSTAAGAYFSAVQSSQPQIVVSSSASVRQ